MDNGLLKINTIQLRDFRCFNQKELIFEQPIVLISGQNGAGKTSLLEALYYSCYLRSFRTHLPKQLIRSGQEGFSIKIFLDQQLLNHEITVGFYQGKRKIRVDQTYITSFKELLNYYRVISVTEDDLSLINGLPAFRRLFIDYAILLDDPNYAHLLREYKIVLDQRNALLQKSSISSALYDLLTKKLWDLSVVLSKSRKDTLSELEQSMITLSAHFGMLNEFSIRYVSKAKLLDSFEEFITQHYGLYEQEKRMKRSLFGAHLDDIKFYLHKVDARIFCSRGQQKLLCVLLKLAQAEQLKKKAKPALLLLDDFMTDFDQKRLEFFVEIVANQGHQVIFTIPTKNSLLESTLNSYKSCFIEL